MILVDLLSRLRAAKVDLWMEDDRLRFSAPPGALTSELRAALSERKKEVVAFLRRAGAPAATTPPIVPAPHDGPLPLSFPQRRMWFFEQVHPGTSTYHMATSWRLDGHLDLAALCWAVNAIADRHAVLRTSFAMVDDEPTQTIAERVALPLPVIDLSALSAAEREAEVLSLKSAERTRPFDLTRLPLLRTTVLRTDRDEHVLMLTVHHIVADMWSADVLLKDLMAFYREGERAVLPELPVRYADVAAWQRSWLSGDVLTDQLDYWTEQLRGAPAFLDPPTDRPRPQASTFAGAQQSLTLPADLVAEVDGLCRDLGVTRFMALLAAFYVVLSRYSGETDIVVGSPVANRTRAETENLIGYFVNTLVLRGDLAGDPTVADLMGRVRDTALGAYEHQDMPVEQLVEALRPRRDPARPPLFQAMFVLQNGALAPLRLPGLTIRELPGDRTATEFDLTLEVDDTGAGMTANLQYNADIFLGDTMRRLLGHWRTLLEGFVADPGQRVGSLPILTEPERHRLLGEWNATARAHAGTAVHDLITRQAARTPDATAVVFRDRQLSYAALDEAATGLAARLRSLGVHQGRPVAVCVERSPEMVVALLGVLKAGAAYLPIDTTLPPERLAYLLDDAGVDVVVTTRTQLSRFVEHAVRPLVLGEDGAEDPAAGAGPPVSAADLAYVIYTSGSTGKPKGVMVEHGGVTNFLAAMDDVLHAPGADPGVWLALTSVSFDIAVLELLWPLTRGWLVVVQDDRDVIPGAATHPADTRKLAFSLFYFAVSQDEGAGRDRYRLLLDGARFADRHGFSAVWTPERHFDRFGGLYPNPSVTAAALATITDRVQLRAGSVVLPLHNPIRVAEDWAVVDNLSQGRVSLSFASGWHADDFALASDPAVYGRRKEAMIEQIETVRALWRGETVTVANGVGRDVEVSTFPRPVQPELPFWLTAAGNPETFRDAGTAGASLLTHLLGQSTAELAEKIEVYRRAWRGAGHAGDGHVALMIHTYVADSSAGARETVREPFREYLRRSFGLVRALAPSLGIDGEPDESDVEALLDYAFDRYYDGAALMGTADECVAMAERLRAIGVDEVACLIDFGVPVTDVLDGLPRLDEVRRRLDAPAATEVADYGVAAEVDRHAVTHLQCTPSLASILMSDPRTRESLRDVEALIVGGEQLPPTLAADLVATARTRSLNMYGPTETTIWSTYWPVVGSAVSVGRPVANTSVYILDANLEPVPVGVPGELYIGGQGVVRGYLNRPALTAERFLPSPFADGARIYRTGDRARFLPDGQIEFLGRVDRQVKLGGHRIELGEIESVLREHPAVRQAAVVTREDDAEHRFLVAYLVSDGHPPSPTELRALSLRMLPEVMVPNVLVWLAEMPLLPSGKVDYRALPDPAAAGEDRSLRPSVTRHRYVAPRDDLEEAITGIWQDVLNVDRVGVHDNFFELGGHSLMAIQMASGLRTALGGEVTLRAVFESGTVAELTERLRDTVGKPAASVSHPLRPVARTGPVPLSFAQQRMWFFDQMNPGVVAYHLSAAFRLVGELRPAPLRMAFNEIVRRHEVLRTNFAIVGDEPAQVIAPARRIPLPSVDLSGLAAAEREDAVLRLALDEPVLPFDLEHDSLLRTTLVRLGPAEHVLLLTTHHIVSDSWSIAVMARELRDLYDAYSAGRPSQLPPLPVQYADFTIWQRDRLRGDLLEKRLDYWRGALAGVPPVMTLPYDRPRPETPTHRGAQTGFHLSRELSDALKALSLDNDVTVFVTLLAAFTTLLHRWSAQEHIVLGVPSAGRDLPELEPLIGFVGNASVLHHDLSDNPRFTDLLKRVRHTVIGAYDHQDLPVETLVADLGVERDATHNPLFQVMFVYINDLAMSPSFHDLSVTPLDVHVGSVFMDLNMAMEDGPDGLRGTLDYDTDLFDATTIDWLVAGFEELLAAVLTDPGAPISLLPPATGTSEGQTLVAADTAHTDAMTRIVISSTFTANPVLESVGFWLDRLELPCSVEFAPYGQVFQQVLDPGSASARNRDGVNVAMLRMEDWNGATAVADDIGDEFCQALAAFQRGRPTPFVVVLCPPAEGQANAGGRWRARLAARLAELDNVLCLDMAPMLDRYRVDGCYDPIGEQAGHIPYTPEFFAALGTCLARQVAALVSEYPSVVVVDGDQFATDLDDEAGGILAAAVAALAEQGRRVHVCASGRENGPVLDTTPGVRMWADERPLSAKLAAIAGDSGVSPDDVVYLSSSDLPEDTLGFVVLRHPVEATELAEFLEHTWLLDPPGAATPGPDWWAANDVRHTMTSVAD